MPLTGADQSRAVAECALCTAGLCLEKPVFTSEGYVQVPSNVLGWLCSKQIDILYLHGICCSSMPQRLCMLYMQEAVQALPHAAVWLCSVMVT